MPNGGSDCCGTCWFNRAVAEAADAETAGAATEQATPVRPRCLIRGFDIDNPFYTYCANHPHKSPTRNEIPVGPVLAGDGMGNRWILHPSPDTDEIRAELLRLLEAIPEAPTESYPAGPSLERTVLVPSRTA